MLEDPFVLLALIGLVLFCTIALTALMLYRLLIRRRPSRPRAMPPAAPTRRPEPRLTEDPKLMAFFKAVDPRFAKEFPSLQATSPKPASVATPDAELEALVQLWPALSARDRHELVELARLKTKP